MVMVVIIIIMLIIPLLIVAMAAMTTGVSFLSWGSLPDGRDSQAR